MLAVIIRVTFMPLSKPDSKETANTERNNAASVPVDTVKCCQKFNAVLPVLQQ